MSEECDRADCRSRAGLANLGSGRRLFVETSSGAWTIWRRRGAFRFGASDSDIRRAFAPHVNTAVDCGRYVNPQGVRKQIEGAAICGNTVVQSGKNTTDNGAAVQMRHAAVTSYPSRGKWTCTRPTSGSSRRTAIASRLAWTISPSTRSSAKSSAATRTRLPGGNSPEEAPKGVGSGTASDAMRSASRGVATEFRRRGPERPVASSSRG